MPATTKTYPRGRQEKIRQAWEATYKTNPASGFSELNVYTSSFDRSRPLLDDDILGGGFANTVDDKPAAPTIEDATWKLGVPLDLGDGTTATGQIGFWLALALGRVTATGTTPKVHSFVSGVSPLTSAYLERELKAAAQLEAAAGALIKQMKFPIGAAAGYQLVEVEGLAAQILEPYTTTGAGTPTVEALVGRVPKSVGVIKIDTVQVAKILSGDMTYVPEITLDRYVGDSAFPSAAQVEAASLAVNLTARYDDDTFRNYGSVGAGILPGVHQVDILYSLGANQSLLLTAKNVRFEPVNLGTQNGKTRQITLKGRAELDASNPMLTATLTNGHPSY